MFCYPLLAVHDAVFNRSDRGDGPDADEPGLAFVGGAAHLHRQTNHLGEQDGRQHNQILKAAKECVHTLAGLPRRELATEL